MPWAISSKLTCDCQHGSLQCFAFHIRLYNLSNKVETHSLSVSATVHLYCAVENRQMSANWRTDTLIRFTDLLELFAMCTFTAIFSPWWYNSWETQKIIILSGFLTEKKKKTFSWLPNYGLCKWRVVCCDFYGNRH